MSISPRSSNSHHDNRTKVAVSVRTRITSRSRMKCVDKKEMYERNLCAFDYERCRTRSRSASCSENATHYGSCSNARLDSAASRRQRPPGGTASCIFMDALSHRQNGIFQAVNCDRIVPVIAATICRVRVFICRITKRRNAIVPTRIRKSFGAKTEKITQSGNTTKRTLHACRFAVYRESDRYNATDLNNNVKKRLTPGHKWKSISFKF
jgi:hypothetical protein